jgi:hypothetical protein
MPDKWEKDSLMALNNTVKCNLKFDKGLRKEAFYYATTMNQWKEIKTPDWVRESVPKEWPGAHGGREVGENDTWGDAVVTLERDGIQYACNCTYMGWGISNIRCSTRKKLIGCGSLYIGSGHIISSCYCPHWTYPQKIAEYLDKSIDYSLYEKGAIAIFNDDICTYAVLACK